MAKRGTSKRKSQDQENYIATIYHGRVSPSSGASVHDPGDVRTPFSLIECKCTGGPGESNELSRPSLNKILDWMDKAAREAWECGKDPALAVRIYAPSHPLADMVSGWIDLTVRLAEDDATREFAVNHAHDMAIPC
jgi:hypothetical protein